MGPDCVSSWSLLIFLLSRPADVTTRSPARMVAECLLKRSMLIKMYYHFMVCACICTIVLTVCQFHADIYLVYLVFQTA